MKVMYEAHLEVKSYFKGKTFPWGHLLIIVKHLVQVRELQASLFLSLGMLCKKVRKEC